MAKPSKYTYYPNAIVRDDMSGAEFELGLTSEKMNIEISGISHPFYTGKDTLVDTAGMIDRFKARSAKMSSGTKVAKVAKKRKQMMSIDDLISSNTAPAAKTVKKAKKTETTTEEAK
jgi:large subunit ribosomal protein L31